MTTPVNSKSAPKVPSAKMLKLAVPFLGVLGALQGADPNIVSTALVGATRGLDMTGGLVALAASISTLALAASVDHDRLVGGPSRPPPGAHGRISFRGCW